jgi:hypothetical protein
MVVHSVFSCLFILFLWGYQSRDVQHVEDHSWIIIWRGGFSLGNWGRAWFSEELSSWFSERIITSSTLVDQAPIVLEDDEEALSLIRNSKPWIFEVIEVLPGLWVWSLELEVDFFRNNGTLMGFLWILRAVNLFQWWRQSEDCRSDQHGSWTMGVSITGLSICQDSEWSMFSVIIAVQGIADWSERELDLCRDYRIITFAAIQRE